jgi:plasmid stabilization system protein ParE
VQAIAQREAIIMFLKVEQKDARHVQDIWRAFLLSRTQSHLLTQGANVLRDGEQRPKIDQEADQPGADPDPQDRRSQIVTVGDDAGQERRKRCACILDEIFDRLGRGTHLGQGDVEHRGDHVRSREGHEKGGEHHQNKEQAALFERRIQGEEQEESAADHPQTGDQHAPSRRPSKHEIAQRPADEVAGRKHQDQRRHRKSTAFSS